MTSHKTERSLNIVNFEDVVNFKNVKNLLKLKVGQFTVGELICLDTIE